MGYPEPNTSKAFEANCEAFPNVLAPLGLIPAEVECVLLEEERQGPQRFTAYGIKVEGLEDYRVPGLGFRVSAFTWMFQGRCR